MHKPHTTSVETGSSGAFSTVKHEAETTAYARYFVVYIDVIFNFIHRGVEERRRGEERGGEEEEGQLKTRASEKEKARWSDVRMVLMNVLLKQAMERSIG